MEAIGGTNIQREDRGRRADLLAYKPQAQESRDCPSVCGDMNARITREQARVAFSERKFGSKFDTAERVSGCKTRLFTVHRIARQRNFWKSIRRSKFASGTNGDLVNGARTNEKFPSGYDNRKGAKMMEIYLEDRPRRRREVQLHGTRIPQKMSEEQRTANSRVVEWRNENKQLS